MNLIQTRTYFSRTKNILIFLHFLTVNVFSETIKLFHNFSSFKQVFGQCRIRHFDLGCDCRNSSPESPEHRQLDHYLLRFPLWLHHFKNFRRSFGKHPTIRYHWWNLKPEKMFFWYCLCYSLMLKTVSLTFAMEVQAECVLWAPFTSWTSFIKPKYNQC